MQEILQTLIAIMEERKRNDMLSTATYGSSIKQETWDRAIGIVNAQLNLSKEVSVVGGSSSVTHFERLVERRITQIRNTLNRKAAEYATNNDRFHNFKVAARILKITPEKALKGMMAKHEVSVMDLINSCDKVTREMIDEKIGDNINYLILLEGLLVERIND